MSIYLDRFMATTAVSRVELVRDTVARGLKIRGVRVRQPLASATLIARNPYVFNCKEHRQTLIEEWNVKRLTILKSEDFTNDPDAPDAILFDCNLTPELIAEGQERDRIRADRRTRKGVYKP